MILYVLHLDTNKTIKLWNQSLDTGEVIAQMFDNGKKSRKSKYKIRDYNGKKYIVVCGHRYYLDKFTEVEI